MTSTENNESPPSSVSAEAAPPPSETPAAAAPAEAPRTESAANAPAAPPSAEAPPASKAPPAAGEAPTPAPKAPPASQPRPAQGEASAQAEPEASFFRRRFSLQSAKQSLQPAAPPAPPPPRKRRRDGTLSALSGFLSFLLLLVVAGAFGVIAASHKLTEPGPLPADKTVYLPPRSDLPEILAQLEREGVIDSPALMQAALLVEGVRSKVKPGEYAFRQKVSLREVIDELVAGRQVLHPVTVPEGLTSEQIVQRLKEIDFLEGEVREVPKEGALLPETYKVARGYPRSKLLQKMQEDQRKLVDQIWRRRAHDLPVKTPYELVTLASIVEKETGKAEERPHVAAVFANRLRKGMRLQSDPTIVYGIVGGKATLGRGINRSEIDAYTPYNTYAIDGLPPGPIANPGRAALEAAANPAPSQDLYFVADGAGGHVFSESLDQHARNVQRWRQIEHDQKAKAAVPAGAGADHAAPLAPAPTPPVVLPAQPGRDRRGDAAPLHPILPLAGAQDYPPPAHANPAQDGAAVRLGRFAPHEALFAIGGVADASAPAARAFAALRRVRPFFTHASAQITSAPAGIDIAAGAAAPPPPAEEDSDVLAMAPESADGRALAPDAGVSSYPVSPRLRAEQKARAAKLGLSSGSDQLPPEVIESREVDAYAAAPQPAPAAQRGRPRAFDASEGTALDPLRDKSWDLTSAKTVPASLGLK